MTRLKCIISYDGTHFSGYQIQPNGRTVQEEIEKVLTTLHKGRFVRITSSGRTDAGVHAKGQVIHFDTDLVIPMPNWRKALNALLPADVQIQQVEEVRAAFHSRYDAKVKEYRYFVWPHELRDVFKRNYCSYLPGQYDLDAIRQACILLEGKHDFTSFCSTKTDLTGEKVREVYQISCAEEEGMLVFTFRGSGFLYNMVRILVGTLLEVGQGKRKAEEMKKILTAKDRTAAGKTVSPEGLFLWRVEY